MMAAPCGVEIASLTAPTGDENATAAESAGLALEVILADLRQMAVRPKPEPLSESFRLSNDRRSIAFLRSESSAAVTTAAKTAKAGAKA